MTASPDTPDKEHKKWVIPVDYNLYCKIGETIYFFNQDEVDAYYELATPSEEDSDEDSGQLAPCDILDWMEEKVGHDGITAWGHFDEIRLMDEYGATAGLEDNEAVASGEESDEDNEAGVGGE